MKSYYFANLRNPTDFGEDFAYLPGVKRQRPHEKLARVHLVRRDCMSTYAASGQHAFAAVEIYRNELAKYKKTDS
jgi:hypothetical protein